MAEPPKRIATVFGWIAGGCAGLLASYGAFAAFGAGYPVTAGTFVLFVAGAFGGMALADRLGTRAFRVMGIAAGVLLALTLTVLVTVVLSGGVP